MNNYAKYDCEKYGLTDTEVDNFIIANAGKDSLSVALAFIALAFSRNANAAAKDDGLTGKAAEVGIRSYMMRFRKIAKRVKAQGKVDIVSTKFSGKAENCEIKTACGKLRDTLKESCKWVIYCPDVDFTFGLEFQFYVFSHDEWVDFLEGYDGRGKFLRTDSKGEIHIQSFYVSETKRPGASKPMADYIWNTCNMMPMLADFYEE